MQCLTCGMMNIDPLSHTHTKETQPMSDTLPASAHRVNSSGNCSISGCPCRGWSAQETAKEVTEHKLPHSGMNPTCLRCFNDGWDAHQHGLHPANFHAGFATKDAPHTCNQHQSLVAERERLLEALRGVGMRLHGIQAHASSGAENAYDIASDLRGLRDEILRILNEQRSTSE